MTNCPNCGAPIVTDVCAYCGTVFGTYKECSHNVERLLDSGIITANEARKLCGLERIEPLVPEWQAPISPICAYCKGEIVRYEGELRRSLINNNVYQPIYGFAWQPVESI